MLLFLWNAINVDSHKDYKTRICLIFQMKKGQWDVLEMSKLDLAKNKNKSPNWKWTKKPKGTPIFGRFDSLPNCKNLMLGPIKI
jgi:hypothetical protein